VSSNVELRLLATILYTGDYSPITNGEITSEVLTTDSGKILFNFITGYRGETNGGVRFPSLVIARSRFENSAIEIPDPDPSDTLPALVHEVRAERFRTNVAQVAHELSMACERPEELPEAVNSALASLKGELLPIQRARRASLTDHIQDVLANYDCGAILTAGIPWPWPSMTYATKGLHPKQFVVIAGRPKSRKTFVAIAIAAHAVMEHGARVLFISPEMPPEQILLRFIASLCKLHYMEFKDGSLAPEEKARLITASRRYGRLKHETDNQYALRFQGANGTPMSALPCFEVIQGTSQTAEWIEAQIEVYRPDLVIVDSFYRLRVDGGRRNDADWKAVTAVSRALKDLAMNTGVALVGTHQMNREAEGRLGTTGNLALADAVGQDADFILRVITGKLDGIDRSALLTLGGREVPFDGVITNNRPCYDFSEIATITDRRVVEQLLHDVPPDAEDEKKEKKKVAAKSRIGKIAEENTRIVPAAFTADDDLIPNEEGVPGG
jgi:replicative DNA helicase